MQLLYVAVAAGGVLALGALAFALTGWAMQPARRAERMEREFLAAASHELKSPLAVIITSAELLPSGGEEAKYRANILSEAHRMAQLVQELLSLSVWRPLPVRSCRQSWTPRPFWEVYETWQPVAAKAGDRLTLRLPDGALPPIRADEDALKQVMAILLSNAVQHTPSGTQIELSAVAAGRTVCLSVADTGPGIADKERAFKVLSRRPANRRCQPGSGPEHRAEACGAASRQHHDPGYAGRRRYAAGHDPTGVILAESTTVCRIIVKSAVRAFWFSHSTFCVHTEQEITRRHRRFSMKETRVFARMSTLI